MITKEAMLRLSSFIARAALAVMISVGSLLAQATGSLTGVVFDPLGEPLPGVDVQVSVPSGKIFKANTSPKGAYSVGGLPAGNYQVAVLVNGHRSFVQQGVAVGAGKTVKLEIRLKDDGQLGAIGDNAIAAAAIAARNPVPAGPTPKALDGHPDLSGVWAPTKRIEEGKPDMLPWAAAKVKERIENHTKDIPTAFCLPWGPTFDIPVTFKFIQAPKTIVILWEDVFSYRQIHMDGRSHPTDADPTWMGNSIGRWDGDTLVVDTTGMNDKGWSPIPYPRTEKFHMIERIRRPDLGHLEIETTIEDVGTYTKPWSFKVASTLLANDEIGEYICVENNQYAGHAR
jgi:hypothetical protein